MGTINAGMTIDHLINELSNVTCFTPFDLLCKGQKVEGQSSPRSLYLWAQKLKTPLCKKKKKKCLRDKSSPGAICFLNGCRCHLWQRFVPLSPSCLPYTSEFTTTKTRQAAVLGLFPSCVHAERKWRRIHWKG